VANASAREALHAPYLLMISAAVGRTARPGLWPLLGRSAAPMGQPGPRLVAIGASGRLGGRRALLERSVRPYVLTGARGASTQPPRASQQVIPPVAPPLPVGALARLTAPLLDPAPLRRSRPGPLEPSGHRSPNRSARLPHPFFSSLSPPSPPPPDPPPPPLPFSDSVFRPSPFPDHHHSTNPVFQVEGGWSGRASLRAEERDGLFSAS